MDIEIKIDETQKEVKVLIIAPQMNESVAALARRLGESQPEKLLGYLNNQVNVLDLNCIERIVGENEKVYAYSGKDGFQLKMRLYEAEEKLKGSSFTRISNSEFANFDRVKKLDLSFTGTICVIFESGSKSFVSRRYMSKIKEFLGL
ncbi:MAG: LytTR family DNA-binding domain-containing protein [Anaerolineaceae bacterium]|nr:LytTR family DNA-binding domain-containing protein [Anaerolineaceae bacterium]